MPLPKTSVGWIPVPRVRQQETDQPLHADPEGYLLSAADQLLGIAWDGEEKEISRKQTCPAGKLRMGEHKAEHLRGGGMRPKCSNNSTQRRKTEEGREEREGGLYH